MNGINPFQSKEEIRNAYFSFLDQLLSCYMSVQQSKNPAVFQGRGIVIPEVQVTTALSNQSEIELVDGLADYFHHLQSRVLASAFTASPFSKLFQKLQATDFQQLLIILALAVEHNRKYERIFGFLQDNIAEKRPTLGLALNLYTMIEPLAEEELTAFRSNSNLLSRYIFYPFKQDASLLSQPLVLRQSALHYLYEIKQLPEILSLCCKYYDASQEITVIANEEQLKQALAFAKHMLKSGHLGKNVGLLQLLGKKGVGKKFTLQFLAKNLSTPVLAIDCSSFASLSREDRKAAMEEVTACGFLSNAIIALLHFDMKKLPTVEAESVGLWLLKECAFTSSLVISIRESPMNFEIPHIYLPLTLHLPPFTIGEQKAYWENCANTRKLPMAENVDFLEIANVFSLTPRQIESVLSMSWAQTLANNEKTISKTAIAQGVRLLCSSHLKNLAKPLNTHFDWEDLKLEKEILEALHQFCHRLRFRYQVGEVWGFNQKLPYGKGISLLLYGPPGTGKTMAAQVLAKEFGLDAYRVDMSQIIDKYIGETEKKLAELFDAAKDSNAILFFDEADALFAKRTDVTDAKDKYANVETAYLLQLIEEHNGITILATNIAQNLDEAFKRRLSFMIPITMPSEETRKWLWHSVFPSSAPIDRQMLDFFAKKFEFSGSSIKNIAITAAYLAAAEGTTITRQCIVRALKQEAKKKGQVIMEHELY